MAHFILVHGAFHNATSWSVLIPELTALGHTSEAIDLPSHGRDTTPKAEVNLETYADAVVERLRARSEPSVLVGHSLGGMVITQAADTFLQEGGQIRQLIYIAAIVPRNGQASADIASQPEGDGDLVRAHMQVAGKPPIAVFPAEHAAEAFYHQCDERFTKSAIGQLEPQPVMAFLTQVTITDDRALDRRFVLTTEDRAVPTPLQRKMVSDTHFTEVVELKSDHSPMLSHPKELAAILDCFTHP